VRDELLSIRLPDTSTGTLNVDQTTHRGVELGLAADLLGTAWTATPEHRLVLRGAWTYGDFRFDNDVPGVPNSDGNRIAGIAPHLLRGELLWEHRSGWYAGPTAEWVPVKSFIDHANTFSADPYALLGAKLGYRAARGWAFFIEGKNLLDETYAATHGVILNAAGTDQAQFLPGDGRSVFAGVEYRF
jgi:iron complex outermembrane recepter protein